MRRGIRLLVKLQQWSQIREKNTSQHDQRTGGVVKGCCAARAFPKIEQMKKKKKKKKKALWNINRAEFHLNGKGCSVVQKKKNVSV